jgi:hypothetical protein
MRHKCFRVKQRVDIVNKIFFPAIEYRLGVCTWKPQMLTYLERLAANVIYCKMNLWGWQAARHLQPKLEQRGFGLKRLHQLYYTAKVTTFLYHGLNSSNKIAATTARVALRLSTPHGGGNSANPPDAI